MKKRFCPRPYRHMHFDPHGNVRLCSWMDISIGNILREDIREIWNGEKARKLRKSFEDGSFRFCRKTSCPYLENDSLEYLDEATYKNKAILSELPKSFNVANDFVCNHKCPSCRMHIYQPDEEYLAQFRKGVEVIKPLLNQAQMFSASGNGDLFSSPHMLEMLSDVHPIDKTCRIEIETNGALFDEKHWSKISHFGEYEFSVAVTPNSFDEMTYKYLNGGVNDFSHMMDNLCFIRELHEKGIVNHFEISIVVQEKNYQELPSFARRCIKEFGVDRVMVKPLYNWFQMSDEEFWFKDVLNPQHPYHSSWKEVMQDPILEDPHVYLWGARNEHPSMRHPAYRYKDMVYGLGELVVLKDIGKAIELFMLQECGDNLIFYGDNELTDLLVDITMEQHPFRIMARDSARQSVRGIPIEVFCSESLGKNDVVIVLNFDKFDQIKRDFDFGKFSGKLIAFPQWVKMLTACETQN